MIILGIDAAWTPKKPSGVALVQRDGDLWRCLGLAPSYDSFIALADGRAVDWPSSQVPGGPPDVPGLLRAATTMTNGMKPMLITVDIPLALDPIVGRRTADDLYMLAHPRSDGLRAAS